MWRYGTQDNVVGRQTESAVTKKAQVAGHQAPLVIGLSPLGSFHSA
jgi:hypothetical protein